MITKSTIDINRFQAILSNSLRKKTAAPNIQRRPDTGSQALLMSEAGWGGT